MRTCTESSYRLVGDTPMARNDDDDGFGTGTDGNYGEPLPYDKNFKGPKFRNRHCTDVFFLALFVCFLTGWGFLARHAFQHGDLNKLTVPTDSQNQKCGIDSSVLDKKYLFFFNIEKCLDPIVPITGCPTPQVCIESCPREAFYFDEMKTTLSFAELKKRLICLTDEDKERITTLEQAEAAVAAERCARMYISSAPFMNRCIWEFGEGVCKLIPRAFMRKEPQALPHTMSAGNQMQSGLAKAADEPLIQCRKRTLQTEEVIKEKLMHTNTNLAKIIGNMVAHFSSSVPDAQRVGEEIVEDLLNTWNVVLVVLACMLLTSLFYIALMRWLAAPILWFSIFGVLIGLAVGVTYSYKNYTFWRNTAAVPIHGLNVQNALKNALQDPNNWLYLTIILGIALVVLILMLLIFRTRIRLAIALTKEGSKAVSSIYSTVFFPILSWLLFIVLIVYSLAVGMHLASIGPNTFLMVRHINSDGTVSNENCICEGLAANYTVGQSCQPDIFQKYCRNPTKGSTCLQTTCSFLKIENSSSTKWSIVYNIFGFFWLAFFIGAFSDMVLAIAFATWYWTFKKRHVPYFTLTRAFAQTAFYHVGTLAIGSLILAVCRIIRILLEFIHRKLKKYDNGVTRAILCCMSCFFWLLESFLKFLNRNAYIMCAIHGTNFCTSAKDAFNLIMRNLLRVMALGRVTDFLFFLSKVLLTAGAGALTYFYVADNPELQLHYAAVPTVVVVIASYLITSVFFSVYSMAIDTLFLCFLEDCERNDGSAERPYYMSKQLMKVLGKHNHFPRRRRHQDV